MRRECAAVHAAAFVNAACNAQFLLWLALSSRRTQEWSACFRATRRVQLAAAITCSYHLTPSLITELVHAGWHRSGCEKLYGPIGCRCTSSRLWYCTDCKPACERCHALCARRLACASIGCRLEVAVWRIPAMLCAAFQRDRR